MNGKLNFFKNLHVGDFVFGWEHHKVLHRRHSHKKIRSTLHFYYKRFKTHRVNRQLNMIRHNFNTLEFFFYNFKLLHRSIKVPLVWVSAISLSDRSCMFPISLGGSEGIFVEKSRKNNENDIFLEKIFLNDFVMLCRLCFELGNYLLLCKITASNTDRQTDRQTDIHTPTYRYRELPKFWNFFFTSKTYLVLKLK